VQLDNRPSAPAEHVQIPQEEGRLGAFDVGDQVEVTHPGQAQDLAQREGRHGDRGLPWPGRADAGAGRRGRDREGRVAAVPGHRGVQDVDPQRPGPARQPVPEPRQQPRVGLDAHQMPARRHQRRDMGRGDAEAAAELHYRGAAA
jgi:hypothetical protein